MREREDFDAGAAGRKAGQRGLRPPPLSAAAVLGILFLLGFTPVLFSAEQDLSDFSVGLPATIQVEGRPLNETPTRLHVNLSVQNTGFSDWVVYLLSNQNGSWKTERVLRVLQPGLSQNLDLDFEARYSGRRRESHEYAVVATGNAVPLGRYFVVEEDWSAYEDETRKTIEQAALVFVPSAAFIVVGVLMLLAEFGYSSRARGQFEGEYTIRSLFFPRWTGRPLGEELAGVLIHPLSWLAALGVTALMAVAISGTLAGQDTALAVMGLSLLAAMLPPVIYFAMVWLFNEKVEQMPLRFFAAAFLWGAVAAVAALVINTGWEGGLRVQMGLTAGATALLLTALLAPLVEEALKGFGLLILSAHHEYSDALHGLLLGFAAGVGFAFVENWFYFASKTDPVHMGLAGWAGLVLYRSFFNAIAHGCFSAALGASLGWAKSQNFRGFLGLLAMGPALVMAVVLHSVFNITAILDGFSALSAAFPFYVFNPSLAITLFGLTALMGAGAVLDHRRRAEEARVRQVERREEEER